MKRTCNLCNEKKDITDFSKDTKGFEGYARRCKRCKNQSRKKPKEEPKTLPRAIEKAPRPPVKVKIEPIQVDFHPDLLKRLSEKFGSSYVISVHKTGKSRLLVHGVPDLHYKAETPQDLLEMVL